MDKQTLPSGVANVRGNMIYFKIPRWAAVKSDYDDNRIAHQPVGSVSYIPEFLDPMSIRLMNGKVVECVNNEGFDIMKDIKWADTYETWQAFSRHFCTLCIDRVIFRNSPLIPYLSINDETEYVKSRED